MSDKRFINFKKDRVLIEANSIYGISINDDGNPEIMISADGNAGYVALENYDYAEVIQAIRERSFASRMLIVDIE